MWALRSQDGDRYPRALLSGERFDRLVGPYESVVLLLPAQLCRGHVGPPVMSHLVSGGRDSLADFRVGPDRDSGNEPRRRDTSALQQVEDTWRANRSELPSGDGGRRGHAPGR